MVMRNNPLPLHHHRVATLHPGHKHQPSAQPYGIYLHLTANHTEFLQIIATKFHPQIKYFVFTLTKKHWAQSWNSCMPSVVSLLEFLDEASSQGEAEWRMIFVELFIKAMQLAQALDEVLVNKSQ